MQTMVTRTALSICLLCLGAALAHAQTPTRPADADTATAPIPLEPIEVDVTRSLRPFMRVPAAISRVDAERIGGARRALTLDEALAGVPGVVVSDRNTFALDSRVAIRGFGARSAFGIRGVRILLDGIPLTMPDGQATLTNLDLASADRIEVLRGLASALYGNAAGGVIAINSQETPAGPFAGEARILIGDAGGDGLGNLWKAQGKVVGHAGPARYSASLSHLELDGFRAHSRARQTHMTGRFRVPMGADGHFGFVLNVADMPLAQNPGSLPLDSALRDPRMAWPANVATAAGKEARQVQAGVSYGRRIGAGTLDVSVHGLGRSMLNPLPYAAITVDRRGGGARAVYRGAGTLLGREAWAAFGVEAELQHDDRLEHDNAGGRPGNDLRKDQVDRVASIGPFAQAHLALGKTVELMLGARYDVVHFETHDHLRADGDASGERTLSAFSPVVGLTYSPNERISVYGTLATAFQTPTTTELINAPPAAGEPCCPGGFNNDLEPQRAIGYEVGVKGSLADRVRYELAAYTMAVDGELVPFQVPGVEGRDFYRNAGHSTHRGLELGVGIRLSESLGADFAYTLSDFRFVDDGIEGRFDGNRLPGVPRHRLVARTTYSAPFGLSLDLQAAHNGEYFVDDANTAVNDAHTITDLYLSYDGAAAPLRARPFIGVRNLFDRRYNASIVANAAGSRYYEPGAPRSLHLGVALPLGASADRPGG